MKLTKKELENLRNAIDGKEWDDTVASILSVRDGNYPPDWYEKVLSQKNKYRVNLDIGISVLSEK